MKYIAVFIAGVLLATLVAVQFISPLDDQAVAGATERQPLYWVAPMDANYRRDQPGKSPMGMDLIPVYDDSSSDKAAPGTVTISAAVVNNLGVRTALVERAALNSQINTVGYVQYNQDKLVHLHPRVEGWIEKLYVKAEGDPVVKNQPLYDLYSPELVSAQEDLLQAMQGTGIRLVEGAKNRLRSLKISESAIADIVKHRKVMQTVTFYAPQSGVVEALNIREGFFVQPGSTLFSIGALDEVWVEAEVFARQAHLIKAGQKVSITLAHLPGRKLSGILDYVYPTLDEKLRTLRVRLRFNNEDRALKPNMFAQVQIQGDSDASTLLVPRAAVIRTGRQDRAVLAMGDGRFKSVEVQLGRMDESSIEILSGLNEGDTVVISAQFLLDSESSKNSDFLRMSTQAILPESIWVAAEVLALDPSSRKVVVRHEAVSAWQWPVMEMEMSVDPAVDFSALKLGTQLHMQITKRDVNYVVSAIHIMDGSRGSPAATNLPAPDVSATVTGVIEQVNVAARRLVIARGAIEKWHRPPATLEFELEPQIDLSGLSNGQQVQFSFRVADGQFIVTEISALHSDHPAAAEKADTHTNH